MRSPRSDTTSSGYPTFNGSSGAQSTGFAPIPPYRPTFCCPSQPAPPPPSGSAVSQEDPWTVADYAWATVDHAHDVVSTFYRSVVRPVTRSLFGYETTKSPKEVGIFPTRESLTTRGSQKQVRVCVGFDTPARKSKRDPPPPLKLNGWVPHESADSMARTHTSFLNHSGASLDGARPSGMYASVRRTITAVRNGVLTFASYMPFVGTYAASWLDQDTSRYIDHGTFRRWGTMWEMGVNGWKVAPSTGPSGQEHVRGRLQQLAADRTNRSMGADSGFVIAESVS